MTGAELAASLLANGWSEAGRTAHYVRVRPPYLLAGTIIVPLDPTAPDYDAGMAVAMETLGQLREMGEPVAIALNLPAA